MKLIIYAVIAAFLAMGYMYYTDEEWHYHPYYIHKHSLKLTDDMEMNKHIIVDHLGKNFK